MSSSTEEDICSLISLVSSKKAIRKVDEATKFLKFGKVLISDTLNKFFNKFIEQSIHPSCLIAEVHPIFKKSNRYMTTNYRCIPLLSQFDKLFEKLIYNRNYSYVQKCNLLNEKQMGFCQNHCTIHAISNMYDSLLKI